VIQVVICDDHALVRAGLEQLVDGFDGVEVVACCPLGEEGVRATLEHDPDVVLMDLEMPDIDGVEATRRIIAERPQAVVIVLTAMTANDRVREALAAGARGYLLKDTEPGELERALRAANDGGAPLDPRAATALLAPRGVPGARAGGEPPEPSGPTPEQAALSSREREVLLLLAAGLPNKQIARRLAISEKTVKAHLTNVFRRLEVTDRTQAALWAERHGLVGQAERAGG
jgi:DNA-binding NarL/FixJ family response regulator